MRRTAGIVLAGGRSTRMGNPKAWLEWHGSTLLRRVAGLVDRGVAGGPVVVVRGPAQRLPVLPGKFEIVDDEEEGLGPLAGLGIGLEALRGRADVAYLSSTDAALLHPAFVRAVLGGVAGDLEACVPDVRGFRQPLAAAYRVDLAPVVRDLLAGGTFRASSLLEACRWKRLDEAALLADAGVARFDPGLDSVRNLNDQAAYEEAISLPLPEVFVEGRAERLEMRAATLGAAAGVAGVRLDSQVRVELNCSEIAPDPEEPLAQGDVVRFAALGSET